GEVHAVGVLESGDDLGTILHFEVGLHHFDVIKLAFVGGVEVETALVKSDETVVGLDETMNRGQHCEHGWDFSPPVAMRQSGEVPKRAWKEFLVTLARNCGRIRGSRQPC